MIYIRLDIHYQSDKALYTFLKLIEMLLCRLFMILKAVHFTSEYLPQSPNNVFMFEWQFQTNIFNSTNGYVLLIKIKPI